MQEILKNRLTQCSMASILHRNIHCECCSSILLWWFFAEVAKLPRLFCALQKILDALQQNRLLCVSDIIWMLFFSTPSFGGY